jgi:hypothetical protein
MSGQVESEIRVSRRSILYVNSRKSENSLAFAKRNIFTNKSFSLHFTTCWAGGNLSPHKMKSIALTIKVSEFPLIAPKFLSYDYQSLMGVDREPGR